jgi:hypothetical protein
LHLRKRGADVVLPDEFDPARDAEGSRAQRVADDDGQRAADVGELVEQRESAADEAASTRDSRGRDENEPAHSSREPGGELGCGDAPERMADDVHVLLADCIEEAGEPGAEVGRLDAAREPRQIDGVDMPLRPERLNE